MDPSIANEVIDLTEPCREAVILAGGKGVRLRPYTTLIPKPLVPIGDEHSILEIVLRQLAGSGFTKATIAIGHLGQLIRAYVGDGSQWGIEVDYVNEESPLGHHRARAHHRWTGCPSTSCVMNGDILTDLDYGDLLRSHVASGAPLTVATYGREHLDRLRGARGRRAPHRRGSPRSRGSATR